MLASSAVFYIKNPNAGLFAIKNYNICKKNLILDKKHAIQSATKIIL